MDVELAIAIEIGRAHAGRRKCLGDTRAHRNIRELKPRVVSQQPTRPILLRNEEIEVAVAVVVDCNDARARRRCGNAARCRTTCEDADAVVLLHADKAIGTSKEDEVKIVVAVEVGAGHAVAILRARNRRSKCHVVDDAARRMLTCEWHNRLRERHGGSHRMCSSTHDYSKE